MKRGYLKKNLCQKICSYYKPSKNEDLACMGFLVIEKMLKKGKDVPFQKADKKLKEQTEEKLIRHMCPTCPFYENDCDFVKQQKGAPPCGGLILLGHLLEKNIISVDDIGNII